MADKYVLTLPARYPRTCHLIYLCAPLLLLLLLNALDLRCMTTAALCCGQQVGVDIFVIDPIFAFIFVWSTGLVEGRSVENDILHTIRYNFLSTVMWLIILGLCWAPLQIYLFNRYPVQFRVLVADFIDLIWTCIVSFFVHVRSR